MDADRFSERIDAYLDDDLSPVEIAELESELLADDVQLRQFAREAFLHGQLRSFLLARSDSECLQESAGANPATPTPASSTFFGYLSDLMKGGGENATHFWIAGLAVALVAIGAAGFWVVGNWGSAANKNVAKNQLVDAPNQPTLPEGQPAPVADPTVFARVTRVWQPQWTDPEHALNEWATLGKGDIVDLTSGQAELFFEAGAHLVMQGPVRFQVLGPKLGRVFHGELTARVGEHAKGFSLITSAGKIVDLGTEFGVSVGIDGETDLVVFDGTVDLEKLPATNLRDDDAALNGAAAGELLSRLTTGEAVRIMPDGSTQRIFAVSSDRFPKAATGIVSPRDKAVVIQCVSDTIRTPGTGPFYEIVHGGLDEDVRAYVDRPHEWNGINNDGIPDFLRGADYIKTFNDDKRRGTFALTIDLAQPADLYVLWDNRMKTPRWLIADFTNTGQSVGLDEGSFHRATVPKKVRNPTYDTAIGSGKSIDRIYSIWRRNLPAVGEVTLGSAETRRRPRVAMYGVAAVATDVSPKSGSKQRP